MSEENSAKRVMFEPLGKILQAKARENGIETWHVIRSDGIGMVSTFSLVES